MDLYNHKTQDGLTPIVMLENTHLVNIIRMYLRQIENVRLQLENKDKPVSTVIGVLYRNQPQADPQQMISKAHETLMPYVMEAVLRGLTDEFSPQMQIAYGYALSQKTIETKSELGF